MAMRYVDIHTHNPKEGILWPRMEGVHPWAAEREVALPRFEECQIVGETGLDYASQVDRKAQESLFRSHLAAAARLDKPVVLHTVRSFEPTMKILAEYSLKGVVFHGFVGSPQQAERCFERGYYLSFGHRSLCSPRTREVIASAPEESIFCETDDMPTPTIEQIYEAVALLRGAEVEQMARTMERSFNRLIIEG